MTKPLSEERLKEVTGIYDAVVVGIANEDEIVAAFGDALDELDRMRIGRDKLLHALLGGASLEHARSKFREWSNIARASQDEYWYEYWGRIADALEALGAEESSR